jgi:hypothetical protein
MNRKAALETGGIRRDNAGLGSAPHFARGTVGEFCEGYRGNTLIATGKEEGKIE